MVFVWRYKIFGQFQSKGQCVPLSDKVQKVADALPRTLSEVLVNVKNIYAHGDITIRIKKLRKASTFFEEQPPRIRNFSN